MYFQLQSLTNDLDNRDFWSKFDNFETSFLTILLSKNSFSLFFQSFFGVVQEVFGHFFLLECLVLASLLATKFFSVLS